MKRFLLILMALVLLSGCAGYLAPEAPPSPPSASRYVPDCADYPGRPCFNSDGSLTVSAINVGEISYWTQLFTTPNAASDPNGNEANGVAGWGALDGATRSSDTVHSTGTYSILAEATAANSRIYYGTSFLTAGKWYELSYDIRHSGTGGAWDFGFMWSASFDMSSSFTVTNTQTDFISKRFIFQAQDNNTAGDTDYLVALEKNPTDDGGVYIDNISIREIP